MHSVLLAMFLYQIHFNIVFALHLDHTGGLCCSLFQLKFSVPFPTCTALLMLLDLITQRYLVNGINNETFHIMQFCQASWYLLSHRYKTLSLALGPQHSQYNIIANNSKLIYL